MIGVLLDTIDHSPICQDIFGCLNKLSKNHNCYLFSNNIHVMPEENHFSILQQASAFGHKGVLISTSMLNTRIANNALFATKKYFYVQNLEWVNIKNISYSELESVIHNPELDLIARGDTHFSILSKTFKKPKHTILNWDHDYIEREIL